MFTTKFLVRQSKISAFTALGQKLLGDCSSHFESLNGKPLLVLDEAGKLLGLISTGDLRHIVYSEPLNWRIKSLSDICNKRFVYASVYDKDQTIISLLDHKIKVVPLLDESRKLVGIAYLNDEPRFSIGDLTLCQNNSQTLLIAEIGVNHNGDASEALFLVQAAAEAGFDGIKLQLRSEYTYRKLNHTGKDLGTEYILDELSKSELDYSGESLIIDYIKDRSELLFIGTPFDEFALERLISYGPDGIKVASCDIDNLPLHKKIAALDFPTIISTGMSYERQIIECVNLYRSAGHCNIAFLHCNSTYPTPVADINLSYMARLSAVTQCVIGYSSHDGSTSIPISAIAAGASIIEVHITRSRDASGTDHRASLEITELRSFVDSCRCVDSAMGPRSQLPRVPTQGELQNRLSLAKSICYRSSLKAGALLTIDDLCFRSPGDGLSPERADQYIGRRLEVNVLENSLLSETDFSKDYFSAKHRPCLKNSALPWGIPVRYRDYEQLVSKLCPTFVEFHLSSEDLTLDPCGILAGISSPKPFFVHAIEQYSDGFILDFASADSCVIKESFKRMNNLITHVEKLSSLFSFSTRVPLVINCGGFTANCFMDQDTARRARGNLISNLCSLSTKYDGIQFLPQTMPPFPWHRGGVSHHNLMRNVDCISQIVRSTGLSICLDVSHSYMECVHSNLSFTEFFAAVLPWTSHMHLSDATGSTQEGLQLGHGVVDIPEIILAAARQKNITVLLEIWQGHLNGGKGFEDAADYLETFLGRHHD